MGRLRSFTEELERARNSDWATRVLPENVATGGLTYSQREWLLTFMAETGVDPTSSEILLDAMINEGVQIAPPTEECRGCGMEFSADQMVGRHAIARFCRSCGAVESAADEAFDWER